MRGSKRAVATAVVVLMTLPLIADGANGQSTREENLQEVPVAVSTLTAAMLEERLVPTDAEFVPISFGGDQTNPPTRILSAAALTFAFENQVSNWLGLWDLERTQVLSGPQGTLYGRPGINIRSEGSPDFYTTNSVATGYLAKVEPLPEFSSDEIFEISLAFSWFGEKAFVNTTFAFDPLVGYANFVNSAIIGGEPTNAYGKVVGEEWGQFADPLVGFDFTDADGAYYIGYVLPGIPEAAAFTLSYSPEPSLDAMVAQQVPITQSEVFEFPAHEATVGILDGDLQLSYIGFEDDIAAGGESPIEQPPPTTGEPEQPVDAEEPTTTVALDPEPEEQGMDEVVVLADEPGGSSLLLPVVSGGALAALAAWFMMGRRRKEKLGHTTSAVEHSPQSAGEEIIGQGEAFGLPVVAGWQQIPFGTGGEFQPGGGRVDAAALNEETDVVFAGHPVQWTFDPRRFAFWVKPIQKPGPDGKRYELKVGSPADPNAYPEIAVPPPLQPDPGPIERNEATMASAIDTVVMSGLSEAAEDPPIKGGPTNQRVLIPGPGTVWWLTDGGASLVPIDEVKQNRMAGGMIPWLFRIVGDRQTQSLADIAPPAPPARYEAGGWYERAIFGGSPSGSADRSDSGESPEAAAQRASDEAIAEFLKLLRKNRAVNMRRRSRSRLRSGKGTRVGFFRRRNLVPYTDESGEVHLVEDLSDPEASAMAERVAIWVSEDEQVLILAEEPGSFLEELIDRWPEVGGEDGPISTGDEVRPS